MASSFVWLLFTLTALPRAHAIFNGTPAQLGEFPFAVYLSIVDYAAHARSYCGGTIVSPNVVITSAHCLHNISGKDDGDGNVKVKVIAGQIQLSLGGGSNETTSYLKHRQMRLAKYIFSHESYDPDSTEYDIAILVLTHPFELNRFVSLIKVPQLGQEFKGTAQISGWGETQFLHKSNILLKGQVQIVPENECNELARSLRNQHQKLHYLDPINPMLTADTHICTVGKYGSDVCLGDSGSPLVCLEGNHQFLCGVPCAVLEIECGKIQPSPTLYTAVANFSDWVTEKIDAYSFTCNVTDEFNCGNGACVPVSYRCDRKVDCADGTDETDCKPCEPSQFRCTFKPKCTDSVYICDGVHDCGDGSDELGCGTSGCKTNQFWCGDRAHAQGPDTGACIHKALVCDGKKDCPNAGDELGCGECVASEFQCDNGQCVDGALVCDEVPHCQDGSDEKAECANISLPVTVNAKVSLCNRNLDLGSCISRKRCMFNENRRECVALKSKPQQHVDDNDALTEAETDSSTDHIQQISETSKRTFILICVILGVLLLLALGLLLLWFDIRRRLPLRLPLSSKPECQQFEKVETTELLSDYSKSP